MVSGYTLTTFPNAIHATTATTKGNSQQQNQPSPYSMRNRDCGRETGKVNYRQEGDVTKIPLTCTSIECNEYRMSYDGQIDTSRCR